VAIVGVPNVGKSTLFNRLLGRRRALVGETPGVTRDRIAAEARVGDRPITLVDTGGIYADPAEGLHAKVHLQARVAAEAAAVVLLVVSVREGLTAADRELASFLRRSGRPVILVINKVDHPSLEDAAAEFFALGHDDPVMISAEHGQGMEALTARLVALLPDAGEGPGGGERETLSLAIVGRPNVGKSSLLNFLAREERSIVSEKPGTTRDSVDLILEAGGRSYRMVDTAGIRRSARRADRLEQWSAQRALQSLRQADVALLLLDGSEGVTAQDLTVAGAAQRSRRPLVILINKWDLMERGEEARRQFRDELDRRLRFARYAPALFLSAKTGLGVQRVFPTVEEVWENGSIWIRSSRLNRFLQGLRTTGRTRDGRRVKCFYITQTGIHPPAFTVFTNASGAVHFSYRRYLENRLREEFGFRRTPIVVRWKRK
jgi:GTP-binding protein